MSGPRFRSSTVLGSQDVGAKKLVELLRAAGQAGAESKLCRMVGAWHGTDGDAGGALATRCCSVRDINIVGRWLFYLHEIELICFCFCVTKVSMFFFASLDFTNHRNLFAFRTTLESSNFRPVQAVSSQLERLSSAEADEVQSSTRRVSGPGHFWSAGASL